MWSCQSSPLFPLCSFTFSPRTEMKFQEHKLLQPRVRWRESFPSSFLSVAGLHASETFHGMLTTNWEKDMAPHSSIFAWRIPWTEQTGGLQSTESQRVGHDWSDLAQSTQQLTWQSKDGGKFLKGVFRQGTGLSPGLPSEPWSRWNRSHYQDWVYSMHIHTNDSEGRKVTASVSPGRLRFAKPKQPEDTKNKTLIQEYGSWWWTGRPGVLRFMGSQKVRHDWATELNWTELRGEAGTNSWCKIGSRMDRTSREYNLYFVITVHGQ